jgi:hypothetical protein
LEIGMQVPAREKPNSDASQQYDVFMSYSHQDAELARLLYTALTGRDFRLWWDENLRSSRFWRKEVAESLLASNLVFVIWTSNSVDSREVLREVQFADSRGKPILPLFIAGYNEHPNADAVDLMFAIEQHLYASRETIDEELIERCIEMLRSGASAATTPKQAASFSLRKQSLSLPSGLFRGEKNECVQRLPLPDDSEHLIQRACREWIRQCISRGEWEDTIKLGDETRHHRVFTSDTVSKLKEWLCCGQWYDEVATPSPVKGFQPTPATLAESLRRQAAKNHLPALNLRACPPVCDAVRQAWHRLLDLSLANAAICLRELGPWEGSYEYALDKLECFQPHAIAAIEQLLGHDGAANHGPSQPPLELFGRVLQACSPPDIDGDLTFILARAEVEQFPALPWPPLPRQQDLIRIGWKMRASQQNSLSQLLEILDAMSERPNKAPGRIAFEDAVRERLDFGAAAPCHAEWETLCGWFDAWRTLILFCPGDEIEWQPIVGQSRQLSDVVSTAADHLRSWGALQEATERLRSIDGASSVAPFGGEVYEAILELQMATQYWLDQVVAPFDDYLRANQNMASPGSEEERTTSDLLTAASRTCAFLRQHVQALGDRLLLTKVVQELDKRNAESALELLTTSRQNKAGESSGYDDWLLLCEDVASLLKDELSLLTGRGWPPADLSVAISALSTEALRSARQLMNRISGCLSTVRVGPHSPEPAISWLNQASMRLDSAEVIRRLWDRLQDQLVLLLFDEAQKTVSELKALLPSAEKLKSFVQRMRNIEERFEDLNPLLEKEHWSPALQRLSEMHEQYETFRSDCAGAFVMLEDPVIERRLAWVQKNITNCRIAEDDEAHIREAVLLLEDDPRHYEAAEETLDRLARRTTTGALWKRATRLLVELQRKRDEWEGTASVCHVHSESELPPSNAQIDQALIRIEELLVLAQEAAKSLREAIDQTAINCTCQLPEQVQHLTRTAKADLSQLGDYSKFVSQITAWVERQEVGDDRTRWTESVSRIEDYLSESNHSAAFRLLAVHRTGAEVARVLDSAFSTEDKLRQTQNVNLSHPHLRGLAARRAELEKSLRRGNALQSLELNTLLQVLEAASAPSATGAMSGDGSWLTTPVFEAPAQVEHLANVAASARAMLQDPEVDPSGVGRCVQDLLDQAGLNQTPLAAAIGAIDLVSSSVAREQGRLFPHHVVVAAFREATPNALTGRAEVREAVVGACALLASSAKYRKLLEQQAAWSPRERLQGTDYQVQEQVAAMLQKQFAAVGIDWGVSSDMKSWASRWAVECEAARASIEVIERTKLRWPCGPLLAKFLGVTDELTDILREKYSLRCWFGPCGAAEALRREGRSEEALQTLQRLGELTEAALRDAAGYGGADGESSLNLLQEDLVRCQFQLLLSLFKRDRLKEAASREQMSVATSHFQNWLDSLGDLLLEEQLRGDLLDEFVEAAVWLFRRFERQIEEPTVHLGREARLEDAEVRHDWMTMVLDRVQQIRQRASQLLTQNRGRAGRIKQLERTASRLSTLVLALKKRRAGLLFDLAVLQFRMWQNAQQTSTPISPYESQQLLDAMVQTATQATEDSPDNDSFHLLRARLMMLRASAAGSDPTKKDELVSYLSQLSDLAAANAWSLDAITGIRELAERTDLDEVGLWMRKRIAKEMEGDLE